MPAVSSPPLFSFFVIALCTVAWDYRVELFAPDENCGKSIFHFLLGLGFHLASS